MHPIVIATGNPHKVDELRAIFAEQGIAVIGLRDLKVEIPEPEEHGKTFQQNATIKALAYAGQTGLVCLADDSGLEVDALNGAPGVISSHFSTNGVETGMTRAERDAANNTRLLQRLGDVPEGNRTARFVCTMSLACPISKWPKPEAPFPRGAGFQPAPNSPFFSGDFQKGRGGDLPHWQAGGATYIVTFRLLTGTLSEAERRIVSDACLFWHGTRLTLSLATVMPDHVHMIFMPILQPDGSWPKLSWVMQSVKAHSARQIQALRGHSGPLWQPEYFDTIIRGSKHFDQVMEYVAQNPVRKGLTQRPQDYAFTVRGSGGLQARPPAFRCSVLATSRGTFEGRIGLPGDVPRGHNGFGYDPLFLLPAPSTQSSAELPPEKKNRLSHRGAAARSMAAQIRQLSLGDRAAQTAPPGTPPGPASR